MNQWQNAIQSMAPAAGQPGSGSGNVPYAPGIMSGQFGGSAAQQMLQGLHQMHQTQHAQQGIQSGAVGGQPGMSPPPQQGLLWTPQVQQQVMQYLMQVLQKTQPGDQLSTTGGMTNAYNVRSY